MRSPALLPGIDPDLEPERDRWPPSLQYVIEENKPQTDSDYEASHVLLEGGGDRITYRRAPAWVNVTHCYWPRSLTAETRHHLIAEMLGISHDRMPWTLFNTVPLVWEGPQRFRLDLTDNVVSEEARLNATVAALYQKGFLSRSEAEKVRPQLLISVTDFRPPISAAQTQTGWIIPKLTFHDPRTIYEQPNRSAQ